MLRGWSSVSECHSWGWGVSGLYGRERWGARGERERTISESHSGSTLWECSCARAAAALAIGGAEVLYSSILRGVPGPLEEA